MSKPRKTFASFLDKNEELAEEIVAAERKFEDDQYERAKIAAKKEINDKEVLRIIERKIEQAQADLVRIKEERNLLQDKENVYEEKAEQYNENVRALQRRVKELNSREADISKREREQNAEQRKIDAENKKIEDKNKKLDEKSKNLDERENEVSNSGVKIDFGHESVEML